MKTALYIPRTYRASYNEKRFVQFAVKQKESDLFILAKRDLTFQANEILSSLRAQIESYIQTDNNFLTSLKPISVVDQVPDIIKDMAETSERMGVGPMASVAGAISERVARHLNQFSDEIIVENGGDNYIINRKPVTVAIYAGNSPLSMKLGIEIDEHPEGISICTSSGTVGHSLSFGNADAVTVVARKGSFADASATAICNMVKTQDDIQNALDFASKNPEILGIVIIFGEEIGAMGEIIRFKQLAIQ